MRKLSVAERNDLVLQYQTLVNKIVIGMSDRLPRVVDEDDLRSVGYIGLIAAVDRYDPDLEIPIDAYARHRIRGAILDYLRELDPLTRTEREKVKRREAGDIFEVQITVDHEDFAYDDVVIQDVHPSPEDLAYSNEVTDLVRNACTDLKPREIRILKMYYYDDLSMSETAKLNGVNGSRISQILRACRRKIKDILTDAAFGG